MLDSGCKVRSTEQVCLATLEHYERAAKGWTLYLRGGRPYAVASQHLPKNQVGHTLEFTVRISAMGPEVTDWTVKY